MNQELKLQLIEYCGKSMKDVSHEEIYISLLKLIQEKSQSKLKEEKGRKLSKIIGRN